MDNQEKLTPENVQCPKCGSYKTDKIPAALWVFMGTGCVGCSIWLPLLLILSVPIMIVFVLMAFSSKARHYCKDCSSFFAIKKSK